MWVPASTYRFQFNKDFRFQHALRDCASAPQAGNLAPVRVAGFAARPGSTHGYDVTDPNRINPELGRARSSTRWRMNCTSEGWG